MGNPRGDKRPCELGLFPIFHHWAIKHDLLFFNRAHGVAENFFEHPIALAKSNELPKYLDK